MGEMAQKIEEQILKVVEQFIGYFEMVDKKEEEEETV